MKKKILNTDDNNKLNPMADVRNYGAGTEDGIPSHIQKSDVKGDDSHGEFEEDDEPFLPDEIAFPEEQDEEDEKP